MAIVNIKIIDVLLKHEQCKSVINMYVYNIMWFMCGGQHTSKKTARQVFTSGV